MEHLTVSADRLQAAKAGFQSFCQQSGREGIGRLSEKSLHGILKFYLQPDASCHEVLLPGGTVADIFDGNTVTEIQTGNYLALAKKLPKILADYPVHVYCPLVRDRYIYTVDPETGNMQAGRKSPEHASIVTSLVALCYLDRFLDHPHFTLTFLLMDADAYRMPSVGRQKGKKLDLVPINIVDAWTVTDREDYKQMLPELPTRFFAKDFYKRARLRGRKASLCLKLLRDSGTVLQVGKEKNAFTYQINV